MINKKWHIQKRCIKVISHSLKHRRWINIFKKNTLVLLVTAIIAAIVLLVGVLWVLGFFQTGPEKVGLADSVELSTDDDQIVSRITRMV
jgi:hypothetical protein